MVIDTGLVLCCLYSFEGVRIDQFENKYEIVKISELGSGNKPD